MSSMFSDLLHTVTGGFFENDDPPPRRYYGGPCHHIKEADCPNCREVARDPVHPAFQNMVRCGVCKGWFSQKEFVAHYDHCVGHPYSEEKE